MFQGSKAESTGFESNWNVQKSRNEGSSQTSEVTSKEQESQAGTCQDAEVQTEAASVSVPATLASEEEDKLAAFLRRIEPSVLKELDRANKSKDVLRAIEATLEQDMEPATCLHTLRARDISQLQQASCVTWSVTGAVVLVGLGRASHDAWCTHEAAVHLYNINMAEFDCGAPSEVLATPSCVTCVRQHPSIPSLLAAATYSGELLVWGGSRQLVRPKAEEGHGESVTALEWICAGQTGSREPQTLLTAGLDGRVLAWRLESEQGPLRLQHSFSILCEHLPPSQRSGSSPDDPQPVTSLALLGGERPLCVVGTQAGCVLLCDLTDPSKHDPVVRSFKGHQGAVTSLSTHPSTPLVFASCGQDREIHVYHLNKPAAVRVLHCSRACVGAAWGGAALAWWGGGSEAEVFTLEGADMRQRQLATLEPSDEDRPESSTSLAFNAKMPRLVAVGDSSGKVRVWKVPLPRQN